MGISFTARSSLGWKVLFGNVELEELNRQPGYSIGLVVEVEVCTLSVLGPTPPSALNLATVQNFSHRITSSGHCFPRLDPKGKTRTKGPSRLQPPSTAFQILPFRRAAPTLAAWGQSAAGGSYQSHPPTCSSQLEEQLSASPRSPSGP